MGNHNSYIEFRNVVNEVKYGDSLHLKDANEFNTPSTYIGTEVESKVAKSHFAKDKPIYATMFLSTMNDDEIAAYFNFDDVRFLRCHRPEQLAMLLYKCLEQMRLFVKNADSISDHTSVKNAFRIFCQSLPFILENGELSAAKPQPSSFVSKLYGDADAHFRRINSPFSLNFFQHFLLENKTCEGSNEAECPSFPPLEKGDSRSLLDVAMCTIIELFFVPRFSLIERSRTNVQNNSIVENRIMLLKGLLQLLSESVLRPANTIVSLLTNPHRNSLGPVFASTLFDYIATYKIRGVLPYTSYIGAEAGEQLLALCLQVLTVALDCPTQNNCFALAAAACFKPGGHFERPVAGPIVDILLNPLYAQHRWFIRSQKRVLCYPEVLHLTARLVSTEDFAVALLTHGRGDMFAALLFYIHTGNIHHKFFDEVHIVLQILQKYFEIPKFLEVLSQKCIMPFPLASVGLPNMPDEVTNGEVIALAMCSLLSESTPRWCYHHSPLAARILANSVAVLMNSNTPLSAVLQCELRHAVDFVSQTAFLKKGPVAHSACETLLLTSSALVIHASKGRNEAISLSPFIASMSLSNFYDEISDILEKSESPFTATSVEETKNMCSFLKPLQKKILTALKENDLASRASSAGRNDIDITPKMLQAHYALVVEHALTHQSDLSIPKVSSLFHVFKTISTAESASWAHQALWKIIHAHNKRPLLFDMRTSLLHA